MAVNDKTAVLSYGPPPQIVQVLALLGRSFGLLMFRFCALLGIVSLVFYYLGFRDPHFLPIWIGRWEMELLFKYVACAALIWQLIDVAFDLAAYIGQRRDGSADQRVAD